MRDTRQRLAAKWKTPQPYDWGVSGLIPFVGYSSFSIDATTLVSFLS